MIAGEGSAGEGDPPEVPARAVLRALETGRPVIDLTPCAGVKAALNALFPGLYDRWIRMRT